VYVVPDTLLALQELAGAHRARRPVPLAAVTGSNGKTTTKELLAAALIPVGPVLKTTGNRNNHIGLPLTLLELLPEHRTAVVEIGLNQPVELRALAALARPQVAVITSVAPAHLEGLGTLEGVAKAKSEIAESLDDTGTLVVPHGIPVLEQAIRGHRGRRVTFGLDPKADVHPARVERFDLEATRVLLEDGTGIRIPAVGEHMVSNLLAALAAARALGVPFAEAAPHLATFQPVPGRLQPRRAGGLVVLDDAYNANPASLAASLAVLRGAPGRHFAIVGDMLELGEQAAAFHRQVGEQAAFLEGLVTVGELARELGRGAVEGGLDPSRVAEAADGAEAARKLLENLRAGDVVLVKGSRGMQLETAVEALLVGLGGEG
jgi:UDP-N-acetylmuramoyl-tripeptide--D-alanyl-D-alanine ligase